MRYAKPAVAVAAGVIFVTVLSWVSGAAAQDQTPKALPAADTAEKLFVRIENMLQAEPEKAATEQEYFNNAKKHLAEIAGLCQEYITKYPGGASILAVRAYQAHVSFLIANMTGDKPGLDKAAQDIDKLINEHPGAEVIERLRATMAQYYMASGQLDKAIEYLRKFQETTTDEKAARTTLVLIYEIQQQKGDVDAARASLKLIVAKYPTSAEATFAKNALARLDRIGKPFALTFTAVDGKPIATADYAGKVVLVDCWATWCPPCRASMPELIKLNTERAKDGLVIIGINFDDDKQKMLDYEKELGMTWPQYFDGKGWYGDLAKTLGVESIPATYLVDKTGVLRAMDLRGESLSKRVDELLKEGKN